ncbi:hypothetical protein KKA14_04470, partial [bacterium]|nr:hypothetical protein [bacterium]
GLCQDILTECGCSSGCPSCVPPLPPGVASEELENLLIESNASVACTKSLLTVLLEGKVISPEIKTVEIPITVAVVAPPEDIERKQVKQKLGRAAKVLQKKRERIH